MDKVRGAERAGVGPSMLLKRRSFWLFHPSSGSFPPALDVPGWRSLARRGPCASEGRGRPSTGGRMDFGFQIIALGEVAVEAGTAVGGGRYGGCQAFGGPGHAQLCGTAPPLPFSAGPQWLPAQNQRSSSV